MRPGKTLTHTQDTVYMQGCLNPFNGTICSKRRSGTHGIFDALTNQNIRRPPCVNVLGSGGLYYRTYTVFITVPLAPNCIRKAVIDETGCMYDVQAGYYD